MPSLTRFGVSIETPLLEQFDALIGQRGYANRSEALRDLIRERLVDDRTANRKARAFAVLTIVYDHHARELESRLTDLQHEHYRIIVSTMHVHIDHDQCLEVVLLRGPVGRIRDLSDAVAVMRGVAHTRLVFTNKEERK